MKNKPCLALSERLLCLKNKLTCLVSSRQCEILEAAGAATTVELQSECRAGDGETPTDTYLQVHGELGHLAQRLVQRHQVLQGVDEGALGLLHGLEHLDTTEEEEVEEVEEISHDTHFQSSREMIPLWLYHIIWSVLTSHRRHL